MLDRHLGPVVNENLLPVFRCILVIDDEGGVAVANDAVTGPVLAADGDDLRIDNNALVVDVGLNARVRKVDPGALQQLELVDGLVLTHDQAYV